MKSLIEWRDDWLLGIPRVDEEHQELARLFNRAAELFSCLEKETKGKDAGRSGEIIGLLRELGEHVRTHFQNEEGIMSDSGYPELEDHRYEHATLQAEYAELLRELDKKGLGCLDAETLDSLKTWLISHIANADMRFGEFYCNRMPTGDNPPR